MASSAQSSSDQPARARFTLHRDRGRLAALWRKRRVRWPVYLLGAGLLAALALWALFARGLPSAESLLTYEPSLPTHVRDIDGMPAQTFARERRVQLAYEEYPPRLIQAFISAEDKTFFTHGGIDYPGIAAAVISNLRNDGRPVGASTITQQVAKNLLLTNEATYTRKIKEAILARRIEDVLSKQQILELYLNQIFLGRNAYGVQSAARAYFNKDVDALQLHEMAYLAILPKAPSNYSPERATGRALGRRNYVLTEMADNGYITAQQRDAAKAMPLGAVPNGTSAGFASIGGYFMEEVRRELIGRYGEKAGDGPNSVYSGGLWVRSSMSRPLQDAAAEALRDGLVRFEGGGRWRDPGLSIDVGPGWPGRLAAAKFGPGYDDWRTAVVLSKSGSSARIGFTDGTEGALPAQAASMPVRGVGGTAFAVLRPGAIIAVKREGDRYALRSVPAISGAFVAEEVRTGRVLAMQGGWDVRGKNFNNATQALRQPGSTFKPIVYAAALDNGMTPASIIVDGTFCVTDASARGGRKCFQNFGNQGGAGPKTMRWGLEQSRNLMTVRTASQVGMPPIIRLAEQLGVRPDGVKYPSVLSISLGAGETTALKMTNAFAQMANHGKALTPTLIDYVQDRRGKVILRADNRCRRMQGRCNARDWDGGAMPRPPVRTKQAMDPLTAYQMVHILEGVVERGTATTLRDLKRPLFGKTGTTTGPKDVWFVGGSPDIVAGVYVGYDQPRDLGASAQGGRIAAPIFKQWAQVAYKDVPPVPFTAPAGIRMVRIDRTSGRKVFGGWPGGDPKSAVIWEAFKAETEPRRTIRRDEAARLASAEARPRAVRRAVRKAVARPVRRAEPQPDDFLEREGGIY